MPQVIRDKVAHGLRRPKPPLKKPSGSIATLGLEEIKEQVHLFPLPPRLFPAAAIKWGVGGSLEGSEVQFFAFPSFEPGQLERDGEGKREQYSIFLHICIG